MVQVRSAYRRRGWGFTDPQQIAQCAKEGFVEKLREQAGRGGATSGGVLKRQQGARLLLAGTLAASHANCQGHGGYAVKMKSNSQIHC